MSAVYFTDRDLGRQFPAALREAGIAVQEHRNHFEPSAPDEEWLATVARHQWIAVTHDRRIRYKPNERDAVMRAKVALLVVIGSAPMRELAANFVRTIHRIESFLAAHEPPFIAKVYRHPVTKRMRAAVPGHIEMWLSHDEWSRRPA